MVAFTRRMESLILRANVGPPDKAQLDCWNTCFPYLHRRGRRITRLPQDRNTLVESRPCRPGPLLGVDFEIYPSGRRHHHVLVQTTAMPGEPGFRSLLDLRHGAHVHLLRVVPRRKRRMADRRHLLRNRSGLRNRPGDLHEEPPARRRSRAALSQLWQHTAGYVERHESLVKRPALDSPRRRRLFLRRVATPARITFDKEKRFRIL